MNFYSEKDLKEIEILQFLKEVIDPELEINIVDMGLIYKVQYDSAGKIIIDLTLSSKNCPMGDVITSGVENCLQSHFPDFEFVINLVWEPKWTRDFLTPAGRKDLGMK